MWSNRAVQDRQHGYYGNLRQEGLAQAKGQQAQEGKVERWLEGRIPFGWLLAFVVSTSLIDGWLVVACGTLPSEEYNPLGRAIITQYGQYGLFVGKMLGTAAVAVILMFMYKKWRSAAQLAVGVLALLQLLLMCYLFH